MTITFLHFNCISYNPVLFLRDADVMVLRISKFETETLYGNEFNGMPDLTFSLNIAFCLLSIMQMV